MTADCGWCPAMVALPAGKFLMGSPNDEAGRLAVEGSQHPVTIERPFTIGKFAVTVDQAPLLPRLPIRSARPASNGTA
jgi:formylglycine-generating enzyme required for sulfatase activity